MFERKTHDEHNSIQFQRVLIKLRDTSDHVFAGAVNYCRFSVLLHVNRILKRLSLQPFIICDESVHFWLFAEVIDVVIVRAELWTRKIRLGVARIHGVVNDGACVHGMVNDGANLETLWLFAENGISASLTTFLVVLVDVHWSSIS